MTRVTNITPGLLGSQFRDAIKAIVEKYATEPRYLTKGGLRLAFVSWVPGMLRCVAQDGTLFSVWYDGRSEPEVHSKPSAAEHTSWDVNSVSWELDLAAWLVTQKSSRR